MRPNERSLKQRHRPPSGNREDVGEPSGQTAARPEIPPDHFAEQALLRDTERARRRILTIRHVRCSATVRVGRILYFRNSGENRLLGTENLNFGAKTPCDAI